MFKRILIFIAVFSLLVLLYLVFFGKKEIFSAGKPAPDFSAESLSDPKFVLKDEIGKKIYLINIWATYCPPCREEIPLLNQIRSEIGVSQFEIIALMEDEADDPQKRTTMLKNFQDKIPITYPVYYDADGMIADAFGTYQIPESYLIDYSGNIVYKHVGPITTWDKSELVSKINKLLQSKK